MVLLGHSLAGCFHVLDLFGECCDLLSLLSLLLDMLSLLLDKLSLLFDVISLLLDERSVFLVEACVCDANLFFFAENFVLLNKLFGKIGFFLVVLDELLVHLGELEAFFGCLNG